MASEARLLRNHPSVIGFLIGSDNAPPPAIAKMYVDTLHAEDWPMPIIAAASEQGTAETGPSGMKMTGTLRLGSAVVLVCRQAGWRVRVQLRDQRRRQHPAARRSEPHAFAAGAAGALAVPAGTAVSRLRRLVAIRADRAVRQRAGQALWRTQESCGLCRQGPARKLRQRPRAIRGVQRAHGCGQALRPA